MLGLSKEMVGETGFEPATPCSQSRCATRLRYSPWDGILGLPLRFVNEFGQPQSGGQICGIGPVGTAWGW